jgi:Bacterial extracellular solute-binding proteins, family 3
VLVTLTPDRINALTETDHCPPSIAETRERRLEPVSVAARWRGPRCALRCVFRRICCRGGAAWRGLGGAPTNGNIGERASGSVDNESIRQTGRLRVGFGPHVLPFSYFNAAKDWVGYDIAFAYALGRKLGVHLELIPITDWATLSVTISSGGDDLALGGVYVTDERLQALTVSKPYLQSQLALIVRNAQRTQLRTFLGHQLSTLNATPRRILGNASAFLLNLCEWMKSGEDIPD